MMKLWKSRYLLLLLSAALALGTAVPSDAQTHQHFHENDVRLDTDNPGLNSSCLPQMVGMDNGFVYVVWQDFRDTTDWRIYFRRGTNFGRTWGGSDASISTWGSAFAPKVAADAGGRVYVAWEAHDTDTDQTRIMFNRGLGYGGIWGSETSISMEDPGIVDMSKPAISCDDYGNVYIVWLQAMRYQNPEGDIEWKEHVYFSGSNNYGQNWSEPVPLNQNDPGQKNSFSWEPRVGCHHRTDTGEDYIYVAYLDNRNNVTTRNYDLYFRYYSDSAGWHDEEKVNTQSDHCYGLDMEVDEEGKVYLAWTTGHTACWLRYVDYYGTSWLTPEARVDDEIQDLPAWDQTKIQAGAIDLALMPGTPETIFAAYIIGHLNVWGEESRIAYDTYINVSTDGGQTWDHVSKGYWSQKKVAEGPMAALNMPGLEPHYDNHHVYPAYSIPRIACDENNAYVVWRDGLKRENDESAYYDIYFATSADEWKEIMRVNTDSIGGEARSANQSLYAHQGQVLVVWDDRRAYTPPPLYTQNDPKGAPDTYFNLLIPSVGGE